ncbi:MAG: reverse transcriptase-like protein [Patescibacteria group bacterium]|nr:reverse transcriptase-like protein [Patescibacteria group bacterium]
MEEIKIWTDGGVIVDKKIGAIAVVINFYQKKKFYNQKINNISNNEAEYLAVIYALKKLKQLLGKDKIKKYKIILHLDSELVGSQLIGKYKIKEKNLQKLFIIFWNLKIDFPNLEIKIISREENLEADRLVKNILFEKKLF